MTLDIQVLFEVRFWRECKKNGRNSGMRMNSTKFGVAGSVNRAAGFETVEKSMSLTDIAPPQGQSLNCSVNTPRAMQNS